MGEQRVSKVTNKKAMQTFVKALLRDVEACDYMINQGWFENDITRIGAEQEMVMVDKMTYKPATIAVEALDSMKEYDWVETELAKFNLETNLTPRELVGKCLSELAKENSDKLNLIQAKLDNFDAHLVLTGILPTLRKYDLALSNLTPMKRYKALMEAIKAQLMGSDFELKLVGIDELAVKHDSPLLEACNTSFQVHLQVSPEEFVHMYNIAQALTGPIIAISANSPIVFGKRLWHESRIALFQQSIDTRSSHQHMRERSPRVSFGTEWLQESILEIYREDISRFRVLLAADIEEDSLAMIKQGKVPKLRALQVHNSTVYRWNRPCYGISDNGKPHLRIENRVIPAGPTVDDEVANAALWLGAMVGFADEVEDMRKEMHFADARDNFGKAAKYGLDSKFTWFNDEKISAKDCILEKIIPTARKGLLKRNVDPADIDKYLGIIEERAKSHHTGARWLLRSFTSLKEQTNNDEALTAVTASLVKAQKSNIPVHKWELATLDALQDYNPAHLKVSEFMTTDILSVQKDDLVQLVAEMMDWKDLRYAPVDDKEGNLIGLISRKLIMRHMIRTKLRKRALTVADVMVADPTTIDEDVNIVEALQLMRNEKLECIPVVKDSQLVGIITAKDFLSIATRLLERLKLR
jgi:CBS domain-containing protein/gamma-glutamylcysteine synthetase